MTGEIATMEVKTYQITFSEELEKRIGKNNLIEIGTDPQKAIKSLMDKLGYKVKISRLHEWSRTNKEADIMTQLLVEGEKSYVYTAFYTIRTMIKIGV